MVMPYCQWCIDRDFARIVDGQPWHYGTIADLRRARDTNPDCNLCRLLWVNYEANAHKDVFKRGTHKARGTSNFIWNAVHKPTHDEDHVVLRQVLDMVAFFVYEPAEWDNLQLQLSKSPSNKIRVYVARSIGELENSKYYLTTFAFLNEESSKYYASYGSTAPRHVRLMR